MTRSLFAAAAALLVTAAGACSDDRGAHERDATTHDSAGDDAELDVDHDGDEPVLDVAGDGGATDDTLDGTVLDVDHDGDDPGLAPPPERQAIAACPDYETERAEYVCADLAQPEACSSDGDCVDGLCQPQFSAGDHVCTCFELRCSSDSDCASNEACACADSIPTHMMGGAPACGIGVAGPCPSACLPATCRSSADCAPGAVCAAYRDGCGRLQGWACWAAGSASCGTRADCDEQSYCGFDGSTWRCLPVDGICD